MKKGMKYYMVQVAVDGFGNDTWCAFAALTRAECERYIQKKKWILSTKFYIGPGKTVCNIVENTMGEAIDNYWN